VATRYKVGGFGEFLHGAASGCPEQLALGVSDGSHKGFFLEQLGDLLNLGGCGLACRNWPEYSRIS
jgi:hypothetical protein